MMMFSDARPFRSLSTCSHERIFSEIEHRKMFPAQAFESLTKVAESFAEAVEQSSPPRSTQERFRSLTVGESKCHSKYR